MAAYVNPTGVALQTTETTVFTTGSGKEATGFVRFSNVDGSTDYVLSQVHVYNSSGGSEATANYAWPKDYTIPAGGMVEIGPLWLPALWRVTARGSTNDKIVAMPFFREV